MPLNPRDEEDFANWMKDKDQKVDVYCALCASVGVDPSKYHKHDGGPAPELERQKAVESRVKPSAAPGSISYFKDGKCIDVSEPAKRATAMNEGKLRFSLVPAKWTEWDALPFAAGIAKGYPEGNWSWSINTEDHDAFRAKRLDSLLRHANRIQAGELIDAETGLPHTLLLAWNAKILNTYDEAKKEFLNANKTNA